MLARVNSGTVFGVSGIPVQVETDVSNGLQAFQIVGMPEVAVRESRLRVQSALRHSGFRVPRGRITVNLAPADIPKGGALLDLAIALSVLVASGQLSGQCVQSVGFVGELSLAGELRGGKGVLPIVSMGVERGWKAVLMPSENLRECALVGTQSLYGMSSLREVVQWLVMPERSEGESSKIGGFQVSSIPELSSDRRSVIPLNMSEVKGQEEAKRVALIAAAGRHNCLFTGPPGCGKSMIAERIPYLLPSMTSREALEVQLVRSVSGDSSYSAIPDFVRPFRAPHHTITASALLGGGAPIRPGEVSMAHKGVLYLDELPEFARSTLEGLRQPLEMGMVSIARVRQRLELPASFMLVGAMNPCPCGWLGCKSRQCSCSQDDIARYRRKLSGPILDRIDLRYEMPSVGYSSLVSRESNLSTEDLLGIIENADGIRRKRNQTESNSELSGERLHQYVGLASESETLVRDVMERAGLSARGYARLLRVARTIADIEGLETVQVEHVGEALAYRG